MISRRLGESGVPTARISETVSEGARRLAESDAETLLLLGPRDRPWGAVTCRDMVVGCLACGRDPDRTRLSDLLSPDGMSDLPGNAGWDTHASDTNGASSNGASGNGAAASNGLNGSLSPGRLELALGTLRREIQRLGG